MLLFKTVIFRECVVLQHLRLELSILPIQILKLLVYLDVAMACAARSVAPTLRVVTIEMKSTFISPANGALKAKGYLLHRSSKMAFVEAKVYDAQHVLCAHGTGTFRYVTPR